MATIAKKCSVCGALYRAYNYVDIPVSRDDDDDQEYDDDEAIDVEVTEDFEPINFEPNGFEFVTIKEDMDIQYDFDNNDLCPECMTIFENFVTGKIPSATGNPVVLEDAAPGTPIEMVVDIQPKQDLHGYDHPWVGGAGKNLLSKGTSASSVGITYSVADDGTITASGTATATSFGDAGTLDLPAGNYVLTGCPVNSAGVIMDIRNRLGGTGIVSGADSGNGLAFTLSEATSGVVNIRVSNGTVLSNLVFKPMIRLAAETDATFAPYSNICPITGYDEVNATRTGKNLIDFDEVCESIVDTPSVLLKEGTYYLYVANDKTGSFNTFALMSSDNVNFTDIGLEAGADAYVNQRMGYNRKKSIVTVEKPIFLKVRMQINSASAGAHIKALLTKDATNYDTMPNTIFLSDALFQEIYEPYQSQTVTVALNDTTYGGTLNMGTGELTVDRATKTITKDSNIRQQVNGSTRFYVATHDMERCSDYVSGGLICDLLKTKTSYGSDPNTEAFVSGYPYGGLYGNQNWLYFSNGVATSVADIKTWLASNPLQICYKLAEPLTYHLTPAQIRLLKGSNIIETDAGTITIKYKKAIEGKMEVES